MTPEIVAGDEAVGSAITQVQSADALEQKSSPVQELFIDGVYYAGNGLPDDEPSVTWLWKTLDRLSKGGAGGG
ncbi:hypothetical protein [Pseudoscardovia suis]